MNLKIVLLISLLGLCFASLKADFDGFMSNFGEHYGIKEVKLRYKLFEERREEVSRHNGNPDRTWDMAINRFSAMTTAERSQYLGLRNESESVDMPGALLFEPSHLLGNPASVDNVALGYVTRPKDQRSCGSCWAFTAVAAFEGAYARATNVLKSFSEKEILDCTYSSDGCQGGWYEDAWGYIGRHRRIATLKDAPYDYAQDRDCDYGGEYTGRVPNGIRNARYENYYTVARSDSELESAVARAVVAVAMIVESDFYGYGGGIYGGCQTYGKVGHAVTMVGYTRDSWKVKNSWGGYWGERGYVRFSRGKKNNCRLAEFAKFPVVTFVDRKQEDQADPDTPRTRLPSHGCSWGDEYPCSDMNCNYGCKSGRCWVQCNGFCGITGALERCENCREWCWLSETCSKHEDCSAHRYNSCSSACSV